MTDTPGSEDQPEGDASIWGVLESMVNAWIRDRVQGRASAFPKIDPDHPLTVAARRADNEATRDFERIMEQAFDGSLPVGQLAYLAEQRAIRAAVLHLYGEKAFFRGDILEAYSRKAVGSDWWHENRMTLIGLYMDGAVTGWEGHKLAAG